MKRIRTKASLLLYTHQKPTKKGYPIKVYLYRSGQKPTYWHTGMYSDLDQWDEKTNRPTRDNQDYFDLTKSLMELDLKLLEIEKRNLPLPEAVGFLDHGEVGSTKTYTQFAEGYFNDLKSAGRAGTAFAYTTAIKQLQNFLVLEDIPFEAINYEVLWGFRVYKEKTGVSASSIHNYLRSLRVVWNQAISRGLVDEGNYPFKRGLLPKMRKTPKRAVDKAVFHYLLKLDLKPWTMPWHSRNLFCLQFLLGGVDLVDLVLLKKHQLEGGRVKFYRHKVKDGFLIDNLIVDEARHLIQPYFIKSKSERVFELFPEPQNVLKYQDLRKQVVVNLNKLIVGTYFEGIRLTTKVARHTFATEGRKAKIEPDLLAELMGHEVPGYTVINVYKDFFSTKEKDVAIQKLIALV